MTNEFLEFATQKHQGQVRKYTNEPYINHPINVANIFEEMKNKEPLFVFSEYRESFLSLCDRLKNISYLHDVVEDTDTTLDEIKEKFGDYYAHCVKFLTNISTKEDGNRKQRKEKDLQHILSGPMDSILVKIADVIDNCKDIVQKDIDFAKVYLNEKYKFMQQVQYQAKLYHWTEDYEVVYDNLMFELQTVLEKQIEDLNYS